MKIIVNNRNDDGTIVTEQGNSADDIINLTNALTLASGVTIIGEHESVFIPNDIVDRQLIVEKLDAVLDVCNRLYNGYSTATGATLDPTLPTDIAQLKNDLITIKEELK